MDSAFEGPQPPMTGVAVPLLGRALTSEEAARAATKLISSLPLSRTLLNALAEKGYKSVADLIKGCWSGGSLGPLRSRKIRNVILDALMDKPAPRSLADVTAADLPARIEEALGRLDERQRTLVRLKHGLWDGDKLDNYRLAQAVSLDYRTAQLELFAAHGDLRSLLQAKSDGFHVALRSIYSQLLAVKQGMAGVHEWEDPASPLYVGQAQACHGFAFLCRLAKVSPERLMTLGLDGVCYDRPLTNSRRNEVVHAMKTALINAERPVSFARMRGWLSRIEPSEEFLRRCVEVSRELGFMKSGMIGLKASDYFEAHSLRAMARAALSSLREPAHYEKIAREIERLYPKRAPIKPESVLHALVTHKDEFALAKHGGVYGLSEWPTRAVDSLKDFLSDFLRQKGGTASRQDLMSAAQEQGYKAGSVSTILYAHRELFRHAARGQWALAT